MIAGYWNRGYLLTYSGWWFGTCFIFHNIWDVILPIDEIIVSKGIILFYGRTIEVSEIVKITQKTVRDLPLPRLITGGYVDQFKRT